MIILRKLYSDNDREKDKVINNFHPIKNIFGYSPKKRTEELARVGCSDDYIIDKVGREAATIGQIEGTALAAVPALLLAGPVANSAFNSKTGKELFVTLAPGLTSFTAGSIRNRRKYNESKEIVGDTLEKIKLRKSLEEIENSDKLKKKSFSFMDNLKSTICPTATVQKMTKEGKIKDVRDLWGGGYGTQRKKLQSPIQKPQQNNMNQSSGGY